MITEVKINNFKSVADLTLPLGRFNVLIGANGSGKSNILEAIAFGGAASADKLDNEFLGSRGIRMAIAKLMKSAFDKDSYFESIEISFKGKDGNIIYYIIDEDVRVYPVLKWAVQAKRDLVDLLVNFNLLEGYSKEIDSFDQLSENEKEKVFEAFSKIDVDTPNNIKARSAVYYNEYLSNKKYTHYVSNFIIYSPEISSLRKFEEESQIKPLGVKGEGLFNVLEIFYENYGQETIDELTEYLHIIDWFDDFQAVFDKVSGRSSLVVKDRNLPGVTLNQHNVNEGFLFLLFYISLIISKETPTFFAIDNIEASFHPLLCEELIKVMVKLAKKYDKQIILTTHNPFVLDGLDLNDEEQKLFVVERNGDGETIANSVKPLKKGKLSEAWLRGRIGGNPQTI